MHKERECHPERNFAVDGGAKRLCQEPNPDDASERGDALSTSDQRELASDP